MNKTCETCRFWCRGYREKKRWGQDNLTLPPWNASPAIPWGECRKNAPDGGFDATKEESDEWARSPSGQEAAKRLPPEMRKLLGLDLLN